MTNPLHDITSSGVQSYLTPWFLCPYLANRKARMQIATPSALINVQVYSKLAQLGFRRSGKSISRPNCDACQACVPVRVEVKRFIPNRVQKRVWKKHAALMATVHPLHDAPEYFELFQRYMQARHPEHAHELSTQYDHFLMGNSAESRLITFHDKEVLRIVSIVDVHEDGLSAIHAFFEPHIPQSSFGTYHLLWLIEWCRQSGLPYLHNSFWIEGNTTLAYKANFHATQGFVDNVWQLLLPESI